MKYYAIRNGHKPGIYTNWPEAQKQVKGFPGAIYKSFTSATDAEAFMGAGKAPAVKTDYEFYVDGSFNKQLQQYGSGVVVLHRGKVVDKLSITGNDKRFVESFQIAGEVLASIVAVNWASDHNLTEITIYYDYQGIESWATNQWAANRPISQYYVEAFKTSTKGIQVHFVKVKGHSGNKYNDVADELAAEAANRVNTK